jgi:hypothetical protein
MSSAVQNSVPRPAPRVAQPSSDVDVTMIDTLRAIAPSIDPLVERLKEGSRNKLPIVATRQLMAVQQAAASARVALEQKFPEFKNRTQRVPSPQNDSVPSHVRAWARTVHGNLWALEERIRRGYRDQENPVAVRDTAISGDGSLAPSALQVLSIIMTSSEVSNFNLSDPRNARALGIRSNLSGLELSKN